MVEGIECSVDPEGYVSENVVPGKVTQAEQTEGEEPDQDQHRRSDGTLNRGTVYLL